MERIVATSYKELAFLTEALRLSQFLGIPNTKRPYEQYLNRMAKRLFGTKGSTYHVLGPLALL